MTLCTDRCLNLLAALTVKHGLGDYSSGKHAFHDMHMQNAAEHVNSLGDPSEWGNVREPVFYPIDPSAYLPVHYRAALDLYKERTLPSQGNVSWEWKSEDGKILSCPAKKVIDKLDLLVNQELEGYTAARAELDAPNPTMEPESILPGEKKTLRQSLPSLPSSKSAYQR